LMVLPIMAAVYILYSNSLDVYYIGSCHDLKSRLSQHRNKEFQSSYTSKTDDWELFLSIEDLEYKQARNIEQHIKKMKSRKYIQNLDRYPDIINRLKEKY